MSCQVLSVHVSRSKSKKGTDKSIALRRLRLPAHSMEASVDDAALSSDSVVGAGVHPSVAGGGGGGVPQKARAAAAAARGVSVRVRPRRLPGSTRLFVMENYKKQISKKKLERMTESGGNFAKPGQLREGSEFTMRRRHTCQPTLMLLL